MINWRKHAAIFVIVFLLGALLFFPRNACLPGGGRGVGRPADAKVVELTLEGQPSGAEHLSPHSFVIRAEVADTEEKKQQGLAGRRALEPGYGMLYVYDRPQKPKLSEANTLFPLSLAFIRADGTIVEMLKTGPRDPRVIIPDEPIKYVLEVRAGWFEDRNVAVGAKLRLPPDLLYH